MLTLLTGFKTKLVKYGSILFGLISLGVSLVFFGYTKGKAQAENEQTRRENAELRDEIKASVAASEKIEEVCKETHAEEAEHAAGRTEAVKEAKETKTYDFGKWVLIFFVLAPFLISCAPKEVTVYKTVVPPLPVLKKYERPEYTGSPFHVTEGNICMTEDEISALFEFVSRLKESIKNYESQTDATNQYFDDLREIYK